MKIYNIFIIIKKFNMNTNIVLNHIFYCLLDNDIIFLIVWTILCCNYPLIIKKKHQLN